MYAGSFALPWRQPALLEDVPLSGMMKKYYKTMGWN
jgi:hypothetical protein